MTPFIIGWIMAIVAFISIEAATIQHVSIWFMGGALAGMIAAMCGLGFVWQFGLFVAVSALLLAIFRPILRKKLTPKHTRTNADRLIGREALVTEPIDDLRATGAVRVDGVLWTARSVCASSFLARRCAARSSSKTRSTSCGSRFTGSFPRRPSARPTAKAPHRSSG